MNQTELQIILNAVDNASGPIAESAASIAEAAASMSEGFDSATASMGESFGSLQSVMAVDSADIDESAIALGTSWNEAAAEITGANASVEESMANLVQYGSQYAASLAEDNAAVEESTGMLSTGFIQIGVVAGLAFQGLKGEIGSASDASFKWSETLNAINQILKDTKSSLSTDELTAFAQKMQESTLFTQQDVLDTEDLIVSHKGLQGSYEDITQLAGDLATKMSTGTGQTVTMAQAAKLLTNALTDPVTAMQLLKQGNVDLGPEMIKTITNMAKAGDTAGAAAQLMGILKGNISGLSENAANAAGAGIVMLDNEIKNLQRDIGDGLNKVLDGLSREMIPVIKNIEDWVTKNPQLTADILLASTAIAGLTIVIAGIGILLPGIVVAFETLSGPVALVAAAVLALWAALGPKLLPDLQLLGTYLKSLTDGGLTGFEAKIREMLTYLDTKTGVVTLFSTQWQSITTMFNTGVIPAFEGLWKAIQPLLPGLEQFAGVVLVAAGLAITGITQDIELLVTGLTVLVTWIINAAVAFTTRFIEGIQDIIKWVQEAIKWVEQLISTFAKIGGGVLSTIGNAIGSSIGINIPALASGGIVNSPTLALIGEAGPEAVVPLSGLGGGNSFEFGGGQGSGGGGITINIGTVQGTDRSSVIQWGNALVKAVNQNLKMKNY